MQVYILAFIIALLASWVLTPYVKKLAFRIGALDKPDGRKVHHGIMPRLGGLAIYLAFVIAVFATMHITRDIMALLLGGTLIDAHRHRRHFRRQIPASRQGKTAGADCGGVCAGAV